jgi:hypothetical protein
MATETKTLQELFVDKFRSITFLLEVNRNGDGLSIPADVLINWIARYDDWWKQVSGVTQGRNLHLLYGRNINIFVVNNILSMSSLIEKISILAVQKGFSVVLRTEISDCLGQAELMRALIRNGVRNIILDARDYCKQQPDYEACLSLAEAIAEEGAHMGFLGPVEFWKEIGILRSTVFNSTSFQLIPGTPKEEVAKVLHSSRLNAKLKRPSDEIQETEGLSSPFQFNPCSSRFQIFVDFVGFLYPCNGLIGIHSYSLGTIYDRVEDTVLGGRRDIQLDFQSLAKVGPIIPSQSNTASFSELPFVCVIHRDQLLNAEKDPIGRLNEYEE